MKRYFDLDYLYELIETSLFFLPSLPERIEWLTIPDMWGRVTDISGVFPNLVGAARLSDEQAFDTVWQVRDFFASQGKEFGWMVGPFTRPSWLPNLLFEAGMEYFMNVAGMVLTDLEAPIPVNPAVQIREAVPDDLPFAAEVIQRTLSESVDAAWLTAEALFFGDPEIQRCNYVAALGESGEQVGFSSLLMTPEEPVAVLYIAGTLGEHRGKGVYSSMVARRLQDARRWGAQLALIQAVRDTSAPIVSRYGFEEVCGLDWFVWKG